jgi:hypothetical protein
MIDLDQCDNFGDLQVRMLAPGESAELDLESLAEWGDEEAAPALAAAEHEEHEHAQEHEHAHAHEFAAAPVIWPVTVSPS